MGFAARLALSGLQAAHASSRPATRTISAGASPPRSARRTPAATCRWSSISGDGGFMFTANEMATAVRHRIPLTADRVQRRRLRQCAAHPGGALRQPADRQRPRQSGFRAIRRKLRRRRRARAHARRNCAPRCGARFARRDGPTLIEVPVGPFPSPWEFIFMPRGARRMSRASALATAISIALCKPHGSDHHDETNWPTPASGLARHPFVTIDTEFLRETTYYPLLCVAQIASTDEAVVIDALAPGIDLKPFFELMAQREACSRFSMPRARTSKSSGTAPTSSRIRSSTPRSPPWCWATAIRSPTTSSCSASPATRSTSRTASPTGPAGRCRRRSSPTRSPTSRICATSIPRWSPISASAAAPTGWATRWKSSPRPTPTAPSRSAPGCG